MDLTPTIIPQGIPNTKSRFGENLHEKHILTREHELMEWADPCPEKPKLWQFRLYVRRHFALDGNDYFSVIASMGAGDTMYHCCGTNYAKAKKIFDAVNHWTTKKTLRGRGFSEE